MALNYILGVSVNYIIIGLLYLSGLGVDFLNESLLYYFIFNVAQACIMQCVTYPAGQLYRKLIHERLILLCENRQKKKIIYLISLEIILCGLVFVFNVVFGNYIGYSSTVLLFNGILFLLFFLSTGIIIRQLYKTMQEDYELSARIAQAENLREYSDRLENLYQEIRGFKHDYMNILSSTYSYLEEERFDELKQYYEKILLPEGKKLALEDDHIGKLSNIKVMELKGLLYTKVLKAVDSKLHVTVDIPESVAIINMDIPDLVRILGILLDNAIEAALPTDRKELSIGILCSEEQDYIRIANSCLPVTNMAELFKEGYSEKEGHLGIGLHEAETLLNKHPNVLLNTEYKDGIFIQLLQLRRITPRQQSAIHTGTAT
ncbi:MAG: GHKL domain-containing protein [Lachnospiraceae bacterium]|nr:GHKL domain-containing protein [Lachnospiraceae bacterium]